MNETLKKPDKYRKRYMQKHKMLTLLLDNEKDEDIISWLGKQENRSEAVRMAIRSCIEYHERTKCY